jgi:hypothetical protein
MPINQVVSPLPYKDVTPGLLSLMDKVTQQAKEVGGVADLPAGEGIQNVPVGTMLANIEQATKVISASHKGMHIAQAEEIGLIADLFRENPEDFWEYNKVCPNGYWDEQKFIQALNNCHLVPRSDPNTPSHLHRIAVALGLVQLAGNPVFTPFFNLKELIMRVMRVIRVDPVGLIQDPPPIPPEMMNQGKPGPDPLVGQARMLQAQTAARQAVDKSMIDTQQVQLGQNKLQTQRDIAAAELQKEMVIHQHDALREDRAARREAVQDAGEQQHERRVDLAKLQQDDRQFAHDRQMDHANLQHDRQQAQHEQHMDIGGLVQDHNEFQHQRQMDHAGLAHDREQLQHDQQVDRAGLAHDQNKLSHEREIDHAGLAQKREQFAHDRQHDMAEHALNVHTALHPPKTQTAKKPKKTEKKK